MADAQPSTECPGITCERNAAAGRLIRGMCRHHYSKWVRASHKAGEPPVRTRAVGCKVDRCDVELIQARGLCAKHYSRWKNHGDPEWEPTGPRQGCDADGCEGAHYCRGYCIKHYMRMRAHGDVTVRLVNETPDVCTADGCDAPASQGLWCGTHRARMQRLGTLDLPPRSDRHAHSMGYQIVKRPGHPLERPSSNGWIYEHRAVLFESIGPGWHACHHCGAQVSWELVYPESPDALVVDHLDEDRANNDRTNLVPSCAPCNISRSSRWVKRRRQEQSA